MTPGHPGVRVRNVRRKFRPKSLCICCVFFPDLDRLPFISTSLDDSVPVLGS